MVSNQGDVDDVDKVEDTLEDNVVVAAAAVDDENKGSGDNRAEVLDTGSCWG